VADDQHTLGPRAAPTALALAAGFRDGTADPATAAAAALAAARAADPAIFTLLTPARAEAEAAASSGRHAAGAPLGPLDGVPVAWKDLFDLHGLATTAGSRVLADAPAAAADAEVVRRMTAAGAVCVGRTNMTEFAFSGLGLNPHFGTPANPHSPPGSPRIPGGSSSGSAVAVARGIVPVAIGSDTSGSVRIPAAFNGIVGFKPSSGRYPMAGVYPLSHSLDTVGVFACTVADVIAVDAALAEPAAPSVVPGAAIGARIVVPTNIVFDAAEPAVVAAFEAALARLALAGVAIERRPLPVLDEILALFAATGTLVVAEAYEVLGDLVETAETAARIDHRVVVRARLGSKLAPGARDTLLAARARFVAAAAADRGEGTFVAFPTVPIVAPEIAPLAADEETFFRVNALVLRNTMLASFLDWCGVSLPCGTGDGGLPAGFLLNGPPGGDGRLLGFAAGVEAIIRGDAPHSSDRR